MGIGHHRLQGRYQRERVEPPRFRVEVELHDATVAVPLEEVAQLISGGSFIVLQRLQRVVSRLFDEILGEFAS